MLNSVQFNKLRLPVGVRERQERDREAVSRAILDAARDLFVADGYSNVSIRKIAERIEYSPAAIYSYFPSKDDIFFALAEEGFRLLFAYTGTAASSGETDRIDAIRQGFLQLYQFSKDHPEHFALMFLDRAVPRISKDWGRFGFVREMRKQISANIQIAIDAGEFPRAMLPDAIFRVLSTAVLGASMIRLCQRIGPHEDGDAIARDTLEAALVGLRAGFPLQQSPLPENAYCSEASDHDRAS
jgi:AcrR family transcriptional regulator